MINRTGTIIKWNGKIYQPGEDVAEDVANDMGLASIDAQVKAVEELRRERARQRARVAGRPMVITGDPSQQQPLSQTEEEATQTRKRKPRA